MGEKERLAVVPHLKCFVTTLLTQTQISDRVHVQQLSLVSNWPPINSNTDFGSNALAAT